MAKTFLDRNKKKSALALLLLFLRERKILVLLLLLVLVGSALFLPSSWVTSFPGGSRFAAGVAWVAGKMGVDVSKWGLGGRDKQSYKDLLAAFQAARNNSGGAGGNGVGWGAFFAHASGPAGAVPNSLDMVKGSKSDLGPDVVGVGGAAAGTVAGIVNPDDAKKADDSGVAVTEADMTGARQGMVQEAFAGGFFNGLMGGSRGDAALSGGAFAGRQMFAGSGTPLSSTGGDLARAGLSNLTPVSSPPGKTAAAASGKLSAMQTNALNTRMSKGQAGASALVGGTQAFSQLAVGNARDQMGVQYCQPPMCPAEYASTNSGAIYDGNQITPGFLTSSDPGATGAGLINSSVVVPPESDVSGGSGSDPTLLANCESTLNTCEQGKVGAEQELTTLQNQITGLMQQMPSACGDPCHCGTCNSLQSQVKGICDGNLMQTTISTVYTPCSLPANCNTMGITDPQASNGAPQQAMCNMNFGKCGPNGFLGALMCFLGS
jgi:hypothetical protein